MSGSDGLSEAVLLERAIAGDRVALSRLLLDHHEDLQRYVTQRLSREGSETTSAEDILQQTFVRAAVAIGGFSEQSPGSLRGWLMTIAGNLVRDVQKRRRREHRATCVAEPMAARQVESGDRAVSMLDQLAADTTSPSMQVQRHDVAHRLREALQALPAEQREVIQRYYLQSQSWDDVAAAMCQTKDAVRGIGYRARQSLRNSLGHSSWFFSS